jgi:hypothetical protein
MFRSCAHIQCSNSKNTQIFWQLSRIQKKSETQDSLSTQSILSTSGITSYNHNWTFPKILRQCRIKVAWLKMQHSPKSPKAKFFASAGKIRRGRRLNIPNYSTSASVMAIFAMRPPKRATIAIFERALVIPAPDSTIERRSADPKRRLSASAGIAAN